MAGLLVVYVVSMLAEQTDGFVPFFTQSDFRKMQVTPGSPGGSRKGASPPPPGSGAVPLSCPRSGSRRGHRDTDSPSLIPKSRAMGVAETNF